MERMKAESERKEREIEAMRKQIVEADMKRRQEIEEEKAKLQRAYERISVQPNNKPKEMTDENMCKVCWDEIADTAFTPCGHKAACWDCAESIKRNTSKCPMCRRYVLKLMRIYE
jgi:hypothetical protein